LPIKYTIKPNLKSLMANIENNAKLAIKEGVNEYLSEVTEDIVNSLKKAAPVDTSASSGNPVKPSIGGRLVRSQSNNANIVVEARSPHAVFTEIWPRPHWVNVDKHPEVRNWASAHGVPLSGNRYLMVYGHGGSSLRTPQHWFSNTAHEAIARHGGMYLAQSVEKSLTRGSGWYGEHRRHSEVAKLGWARRRARAMPTSMAAGGVPNIY